MNIIMNFIKRCRLNATEKIILIYLIITGFYILSADNLQNVSFHILVRFLIGALIFFVATLSRKFKQNSLYNLLRSLYPMLLLGFFYKETGYMNNIIFNYFDAWFVKVEQYLWGMQPALEFSKVFPQRWFSELMNFGYFFYYLLTIGTALAVYYFNRSKTDKTVFIIICSFLLYYLFFSIFPVKGPQFYFPPGQAKTVDSYFFSHLVTMVQKLGETETGAFPSSHVGMSVVFLVLSFKYAKSFFWVIVIPVFLLWFATVYIKAHYLIDVIAGFPSGFLVYWLSQKIYPILNSKY